jgi:hypothetical protein
MIPQSESCQDPGERKPSLLMIIQAFTQQPDRWKIDFPIPLVEDKAGFPPVSSV